MPAKDKWSLLIDFSNDFNSISSSHMFEEFRSHVPSLSAWIESCYGSEPILYLGDNTLLSCTGVQQGDLLGPLGFALTLHPIIMRMKEEVTDLKVNSWYLDDGTLCRSLSDLIRALEIIKEMGAQRGLTLNLTKSLLYIPPDADTSENTLSKENPICREGFTLLGCPIGPPSYCNDDKKSQGQGYFIYHIAGNFRGCKFS